MKTKFWSHGMVKKVLAALAISAVSATVLSFAAFATNDGTATITVTPEALAASTSSNSSFKMGVNMEMSMISDEMWAGNGNWMEQTFSNSGIKIMRWGYDAWVFDWENEEPILNNYQGGNNTKDDEGSYGLREFLAFCKKNDIIPLVDIPIESYDHRDSSAETTGHESLEKIKQLTQNMATYINECGIEEAYFDMGNEPYSSVSCQYGGISAAKYGALFPDFYDIVKSANRNFKLILVHQENATSWNNTAEAAAAGKYDGVDDHQYPRPNGWSNYYARNDDNIYSNGFGGSTPSDKIKIMGECNLPWPNFPEYSTGLGSSLALLNGFLDLANDNYYSSVIMWPSHWPTSATTANVGNASQPGGWFDTDAWYGEKQTERFTGPEYAEMIAQNTVLDKTVTSTSSNQKVRCFAYSSNDDSTLNIAVINKENYEDLSITFNLPATYNSVSAMALTGTRDTTTGSAVDTATPVYKSHFDGNVSVNGTSFVDTLSYGECVVVYTFKNTTAEAAPSAFSVTAPSAGEQIGTAQTFSWETSAGATNYHFVVSGNQDMSEPIIDSYTGEITHYQATENLPSDSQLYFEITAINAAGSTKNTEGIIQCKTIAERQFTDDNGASWSYTNGWSQQTYLGCFGGGDHVSHTAGSTATYTFTGTRAKIYGVKGNWCGMVEIGVDDGTGTTYDFYRSAPIAQTNAQPTQDLLFDTGDLGQGSHHIDVTVLSDKNASLTGTSYIELDYAEYFDAAHPWRNYHASAPVITSDLPSTLEGTAGGNIDFSLEATADGDVSYEWYHDGVLLSVTNSGNYTVNSASADDAGDYYARITAFNDGVSKTVKSGVCTVTFTQTPETALQAALSVAENSGFCYTFSGDERTFDGTRILTGSAEDISRLKASTKGTILVRYKTTSTTNQVLVAAGKDYATDHYGAVMANGVSNVNQIRVDYPDGMYANLSNTVVSNGEWHTFIYSVDASDLSDKTGKTVTSFDGSTATQYPDYASWYNQNDEINNIQYLTIGGANGTLANSSNNANFTGEIAFVAFVPDVYSQAEATTLSAEAWE